MSVLSTRGIRRTQQFMNRAGRSLHHGFPPLHSNRAPCHAGALRKFTLMNQIVLIPSRHTALLQAIIIAGLMVVQMLPIPVLGQVPPAVPPDKAPVLRADQIHEMRGHQNVGKQEDKTQAERSQMDGTAGLFRKDTGLRIAQVLDAKSRRMTAAQADQVLVRFKDGVDVGGRSRVLSRLQSAAVPRKGSLLQKVGYERVRVPANVTVGAFLSGLAKDASVQRTEANVLLRSCAQKSGGPVFDRGWGLQAVHAAEAWRVTRGASTIVVAVVDSGIANQHPDLAGAVVPGYNFISETTDAQDDLGHGTQVAGIIAGKYNPQLGIGGVAPSVMLMPLKVLDANGEGTAADVAEALIYAADSGAPIIMLALGTYAESDVLKAALEYAADRKCVIIAAGGNDGTSEPVYPAAYPRSLGVAAVDQFHKPCSFSNRGGYIDLAAPGQDILTTARDGGYQEISGSSAAAAYVTGLGALLLANNQTMSPEECCAIIRATTKDLLNPGWDPETGFGIIDCSAALGQPLISEAYVSVVDMSVRPLRPMPGQTASITMTIRNHDTKPIESATVTLLQSTYVLNSTNMLLLPPRQTREVTFTWTGSKEEGVTNVVLLAKIDAVSGESALTDNSRTISVPLADAPYRDLAILQARVLGAPITPGSSATVEVIVANLGNLAETNVTVEASGFQRLITNTFALSPGQERTLLTEWPLPDGPKRAEDISPVYTLVFRLLNTDGDEDQRNNTLALKLGYRKEHNSIVPFHATGDSYSENKYVHQWIANEAYNYFLNKVDGADIGSYLGTISGSFVDADSDLLEGTYDEDRTGQNPSPIGSDYYLLPYLDHFCAGADGSEIYDGLGVWNSALQRANWYWDNYVTPNYGGNKTAAFYYLGHVTHLLTDMTVPAHTHNDEHPSGDTYEDTMAYNGQFKWWYYGCTRSGDWQYPLTVFTDLYSVFYRTANYTEDYDSDDNDGDAAPYYNPADYYDSTHRPGSVDRSGGFSSTELGYIADDLMPYAIRRVADLYRTFYYAVDSSGPVVSMTYPTSEEVGNPTVRNSLTAFNLTASGADSQSGILKAGYQYKWSYWTGSAWSGWSNVDPSPTTGSVSFTPSQGETYYSFYVIGENGGGRQTSSSVKYMRIVLPTRIIRLDGDLAFGNVTVGQTATRVMTIYNDGNSTLNVSSISYPAGFSGDWNSGGIGAGGSRNVNVTFTPTAAQAYGGNVTVNSDKTSGTNTRGCSGTGVAAPTRIIRLDGDLAFGNVNVGQTATRVMTIYNDGNATLTVSSISYPAGFSGDWNSGGIAAGGSRNVNVTFAPTAPQVYGGNITVNSDKTSGTNTRACSGTGVATPTRIIRLGGDLAFGNVTVGHTAARTLTIYNDGSSTLNVSGIVYPTGFSGAWSGDVPASGSQDVTVTFGPTAAEAYGGTLTVYCDATSGTSTQACSGTGTSCTYTLTPSSTNHTAAANSGSFAVTSQGGCGWSASSAFGWIHTTSIGSGNGTVAYTVDANSGAARIGTITVGGQTFTINQAGQQPIPGTPVHITKSGLISVGAHTSIGLSPDNSKLYAAIWEDQNGSRVLEYSLPNMTLLQTLTFGDYHTHGDVVVSADGCRIFTPNYYPNNVSQVNLCEGNERTDLSTTQTWPADIDITPDRTKIVVAVGRDGQPYDQNNDGLAIYDISGTNFASLAFVPLNDEPAGHKLAFSADGQFVYVVTKQRKSANPMLYELSLTAPCQMTRSMEIPSSDLRGVACSGNTVFVSDYSGSTLWLVNRTSWTKTSHTLDSAPGTIAMHPDGQHLFVLLPAIQSALALDAASLDVMGSVDGLAVNPHDIEFNNAGDTIYISHGSGYICVFRMQPRALLAVGDAGGDVSLVNLQSGTIVRSTNLNLTAIARLDVIDVDADSIPEILATCRDTTNTPTYCLTLPLLSSRWQTDRNNSFSMLGGELIGGPRVWAGDFARDGVLKLLIPSDAGGQYVNRVFRAADGTFEAIVPGGLNWYPIPFLDPMDSHWKLTTEIALDSFTHYLCAYDLTAGTFLWTNTTVNTWPLGTVNSSLVDGTPRLWGGWYGRTLYVTDRSGVNQWQKSFGGSYEAAGVYAGDLLGNGSDALLVGGATGAGIQIDAARLSDGATLWTFADNTAYWSSHIIAIGDADADGSNEVAIWSGGDAGLGRSPKYQVLNGSTGSRLWEQGYPNDTWMLQHARLVDVNNDGRKELLLAVNNTVEARDAQTGSLVKSYTFSTNVTTFEILRADPLQVRSRIAGSGFTIQFPTISGRRYRVESTDDLSSGNWTRIVQDNIFGNGDLIQVTDRNAMSTQRRFYRVVLY